MKKFSFVLLLTAFASHQSFADDKRGVLAELKVGVPTVEKSDDNVRYVLNKLNITAYSDGKLDIQRNDLEPKSFDLGEQSQTILTKRLREFENALIQTKRNQFVCRRAIFLGEDTNHLSIKVGDELALILGPEGCVFSEHTKPASEKHLEKARALRDLLQFHAVQLLESGDLD